MSDVRIETIGAVRKIILNQPERMNAITPLMLEQLNEAFKSADLPGQLACTFSQVSSQVSHATLVVYKGENNKYVRASCPASSHVQVRLLRNG